MKLRVDSKPISFHGQVVTPGVVVVGKEILGTKSFVLQEREIAYQFFLHQHPYVQQLVQRLLHAGTAGLQRTDTEYVTKPDGSWETLPDGKKFKPILYEDFFASHYSPDPSLVLNTNGSPYPVKDLDFSSSGAYAVYNWELFFHVPLTIGIHLSKNQRFAEAQRWFHFVFDPTDDSGGSTPERFWKVRPFQHTDVKKIEEILVNLVTNEDPTLRRETVHSINAWKDAPFRPHVIARYRQQAYMYKTVMAYLDNLLAWGDSLFRQDTGEAIDEAMMLYVLAANILGPRPLPVPKKGTVRTQHYANLREDLKQFSTAMRDVEADLPFDLFPFSTNGSNTHDQLASIRSLGKALYFCVPRNDKLLSYWDTVADRLFKIRNSLNFQGIFRQLALFEPPIDPGMLARAAAAGLDIGSIVNGLNQPLSLVRFQVLIQKATEIVQEVKSLGNLLLSSIEKEDNEALAILRAKHERGMMDLVEHVRFAQLQEAKKSKEGLLQSLALAVQRYTFYELQLGKKLEEIEQSIPELEDLDTESLAKMKFSMKEQEVAFRDIEVNIAQDLGESGGKIISSYESQELNQFEGARRLQDTAAIFDLLGKELSLIPQIGAKAQPMGGGVDVTFGGAQLSTMMSMMSSSVSLGADQMNYAANKAAKIGSYTRRELDWTFQSNLAAGEISQIFKQLRAAQIREHIAELELNNHRQQIKHAQEIEYFLTGEKNADWTQKMTPKDKKTANKALYTWMKREVRGLYSKCFQFAFDIAKKAERALQHELGNPDLTYLQFGYQAGKEGLLAGEKLYLDVKRMEMAYHDLNQREYELTKHVSLLQVDPLALIQLRMTGSCTVQLPETLFDLDGPGHYFRRIKTVAVSIPSITGPYASVNCTLTLLKSSIRKTPTLLDGVYAREDAEDSRFSDYFGSMQSIVTSSAQNDSGLFEPNLRDERYLPFEHSGVMSEWRLELPGNPSNGEPHQFDYQTISDVILHMRYTAREGGGLLRQGAIANLKTTIEDAEASGSVRLFSIRHEFPTEWAQFLTQVPEAGKRYELGLTLREEHYPYWAQGRLKTVKHVEVLVQSPSSGSVDIFDIPDTTNPAAKKDALSKDTDMGNLLVGKLKEITSFAQPVGELKLYFNKINFTNLWIAVTWSSS